MDERERLKLIQRLKTAKTSEERDQILWYLSGQDKEARGKPKKAEATGTGKPAPEKTESTTQVRLPLGKLGGFGSITALLFLFYGMVAIISAVMKILQGQTDGEEMRQILMGGIFVILGFVIFIKSRRAQRKADEGA